MTQREAKKIAYLFAARAVWSMADTGSLLDDFDFSDDDVEKIYLAMNEITDGLDHRGCQDTMQKHAGDGLI